MKGYQADVGPGWWGKLYEELGRGLLENNDAEKHVKPNDWNTYEIVAVGSRVRTYINGNLCVDRDDPAGARSGVIAVQLHSGGATEVRFRHLELTILDQLPPHAAAGSQPNQWPVSRGGAFDGAKISFKKTQLDNVFRSEEWGLQTSIMMGIWISPRGASGMRVERGETRDESRGEGAGSVSARSAFMARSFVA